MPRYRLLLHDGPTTTPESQVIDAPSDDDAKDLAQIALLGTGEFTHVQVWKGDGLLKILERDSYTSHA